MINVLFTGPDIACIDEGTLHYSTYLNVTVLYNTTTCE